MWCATAMWSTSGSTSDVLLILDDPAPGAENMRRDVALLHACAAREIDGALRIYGFAPACLSLGRLQPESDVDLGACTRDGVDVVRRPSGGRAVLHDEEVTYALVCRTTDPVFGGHVLESCARIHAAVARGLETLGIDTAAHAPSADVRSAAIRAAASADCFAIPAAHELVDSSGRKLVGSAQARYQGALLQHGSVLLEPARAAAYLGRAAGSPGTGIRQLLGREVTRDEVARALTGGFRAVLGMRLEMISTQAAADAIGA
jgi:lipoate-protein ligase A